MTALPSDSNRSMTRMICISLLLTRLHWRPVTRKTPKRTSPDHPSLQLAILPHISSVEEDARRKEQEYLVRGCDFVRPLHSCSMLSTTNILTGKYWGALPRPLNCKATPARTKKCSARPWTKNYSASSCPTMSLLSKVISPKQSKSCSPWTWTMLKPEHLRTGFVLVALPIPILLHGLWTRSAF